MLDCVQTETGVAPKFSVIWLHGLGADGNDFGPIVPELIARDWPAIRFVFPHARVRPISVNGGARMRAWYDITGFEIAQRQDEAGIRYSMTELEELIAREVERGIPSSRIFLAGFIALSGYVPLADALATERSEENRGVPIFMAHGSVDPIVPQPLGMLGRDFLRNLGYGVDWHSYPMAHQVCAEEILDLRNWMGAHLASATD